MDKKILKNIPKSAGIYQFFNKAGKIIYIGKGINLFNRVNSYFKPNANLNFGKKKMVTEIEDIKTIVVNNEKESLILETTLIKKHLPKYNILMKDGKNHLYIKITDDIIPKVIKTRIPPSNSTLAGGGNKGNYFGPYLSSNYVGNILKIAKKIFGHRSCNIEFDLVNSEKGIVNRQQNTRHTSYKREGHNFVISSEDERSIEELNNKIGKNGVYCKEQIPPFQSEGQYSKKIQIKSANGSKIPCMDYYTKTCSGPCLLLEKNINEYKTGIENIKKFIEGDYKNILINLQQKMLQKAKELKFEEANSIKQDIESIKSLEEHQIVRDAVMGDYDVINYIEKFDNIYIGLVSIRDSKINDFRNYEIKTKLGESIEEVLLEFIEREINLDKKQTILLPIDIFSVIASETKQSSEHGISNNTTFSGSPHFVRDDNISTYKIEVPKSGPKHDLLKFVYKNIYEYAYKKHLDSLSTKGFTKQTMKNLLNILGYNEINKNIVFECNDISHLSGTNTVASRSVIENGKPNKQKYRKFNIKTLSELKIDDFSSMKEIMTRRLKELIEKGNLPDLIIIDGGIGQLSSVLEIIENTKLQMQNSVIPAKAGIYKNDSNSYINNVTNVNNNLIDSGINPEGRISTNCLLLSKLQLVSIAKKEEELFLPRVNTPIILDKDSQELKLIQKIRDEAHRFAITFNKEKRLKSEKRNILESIPGIGPKTRSKLIKKYGNIDNLKGVNKKELKEILSINQIESLENHGLI